MKFQENSIEDLKVAWETIVSKAKSDHSSSHFPTSTDYISNNPTFELQQSTTSSSTQQQLVNQQAIVAHQPTFPISTQLDVCRLLAIPVRCKVYKPPPVAPDIQKLLNIQSNSSSMETSKFEKR
uniref:Uncharacterized protein n=1 Tax=Solanum lycopersicum TaxID=4081 RepID=A0A3Q7FJL3_SOLLC